MSVSIRKTGVVNVGAVTQETYTGSIVTFNSQYAGLPLKSCKVNIPVTQEGTGDPSPDNVRNFVGVDSLDFSATGRNLWGGKYLLQDFINMNMGGGFTYDDEKLLFGAGQMSGSKVIHTANFKANTRYTLILTGYNSYYGLTTNMSVLYTDNTRTDISFPNNTPNVKQIVVFVTTANKTVQAITGRNAGGNTTLYYNECALLEGVKTADDFVPFGDNKLFTFGQTIYAGELDVLTGIFTATHKLAVFDGSEYWVKSSSYSGGYYIAGWVVQNSMEWSSEHLQNIGTTVSNLTDYSAGTNVCYFDNSMNFKVDNNLYPTVADFKNFLSQNNLQLWYPLPTPEVINLGGMNISTLQGENNLFASTGETTLTPYAGGFNEINAVRASIAEEYINSTEFIEI